MGGSSGSAPAAPDPYATAAAQTASNKETAIANANLNRLNQYTPQGSIEYNQVGTNEDGTPKYTVTTKMSGDEQAKYDASNQATLGMYNTANSMLGQVQDATSKPLSFDSFTPQQTNVQAGQLAYGVPTGQVQSSVGNVGQANGLPFGVGGNIQNGLGYTGQAQGVSNRVTQGIQTGLGNTGQAQGLSDSVTGGIQRSMGDTGQAQSLNSAAPTVQQQLDYSGLSAVPTDYAAASKAAYDASYGQATSRLDPQWQQSQSDFDAKMAAMGISNNSDAYRRELQNLSNARTDAYNQAQFSAQSAGQQAQQQAYAQAMAVRQQQQNEANTQGNFANAAQSQIFGQDVTANAANNAAQQQNYTQTANNMQLANSAQQQAFGQAVNVNSANNAAQNQNYNQALSTGNFANSAQNQRYTQSMGVNAANNAAQAQNYGQTLSTGNFANSAQQQAYQQAVGTQTLNNTAQDQNYTQAMGMANLFNTAQGQQFSQQQANAALNNTAQQQAFAQGQQNAALNNAGRAQQISEASYLRELPINEMAALLGTGSVNMPQAQSVANANVQNTDISGNVYSSYNGQMAAYNAQQQAKSSMLGSIFGAAGSLGSAAIMASDRRFKENIKRVGTLANGLATYTYNYVWSKAKQFGVMAQEVAQVLPDAVLYDKDGFMFVDYRKVL